MSKSRGIGLCPPTQELLRTCSVSCPALFVVHHVAGVSLRPCVGVAIQVSGRFAPSCSAGITRAGFPGCTKGYRRGGARGVGPHTSANIESLPPAIHSSTLAPPHVSLESLLRPVWSPRGLD